MVTNFWANIGKIELFTFIRNPGILKRIAISPFWFENVHLRSSGYIVWKFGELEFESSSAYTSSFKK